MEPLKCFVFSNLPDLRLNEALPLEDVIHDICDKPRNDSVVVRVCPRRDSSWPWTTQPTHRVFHLWAFPVTVPAYSNLDEAVEEFETWLDHGESDYVMLCDTGYSREESSRSFLICFKQADSSSEGDCEASHSYQGELLGYRQGYSTKRILKSHRERHFCQFPLTSVLVTVLTVSVIVLVATNAAFMIGLRGHTSTRDFEGHTISSTQISHNQPDTTTVKASQNHSEWIIPPGNVGPPHQSYLLPWNKTTVASEEEIAQHFVLRLDDQALMPVGLVDEHERRVQSWFATNFPILASVRDSGKYLSASFLDYNGTRDGPERLLMDERYHIAHCTTAFRRYLRALNSGKHVCPRDLDLGHLDHCTMQLESFAYRDRKDWGSWKDGGLLEDRMMAKDEEFDPASTQVMLVWHTDICY